MTRPNSEPNSPETSKAVTIEGETFASPPQRLAYPDIEIPAPGQSVEVAPGIHWLRIPMPMDLNHINLWLLADGDGWTLVDSGLNADLCKEAWASLASTLLRERPLKRIFITHLHPDHVGLACWLQEKHKCPAWMSARGLALTRVLATEPTPSQLADGQAYFRSHGYTDSAMITRFVSGTMYRAAISGVPDISNLPNDGDTVQIGSDSWRIYETNGHAEGHQCLHERERRILISGDQVLPTISSNVSFSPKGTDENPLASYLESLERLGKLDVDTLVLPSHGRPFRGLQFRTSDLIAHHRDHLAAMKKACTEPRTAFDCVPVLFKRRLIGSHWLFAMGETIAHAEYLVQAGEMVRRTDGEGVVRYCTS